MKKILLFTILLPILFFAHISSAQSCPLSLQQTYKSPNSTSVYYITKNCTKKTFKRADVFFTYFDSWKNVSTVSVEMLNSIPYDSINFMPWGPKYDPKYGALVKTINDSKVYLLLGGQKHWIASGEVFNGLNYSWNWIEDVDQRLLDKYSSAGEINYIDRHPNYTLIKYANDAKVYRLEPDPNDLTKQIKRHIQNEAEFNALGFRWDRIVTIKNSEVYTNNNTNEIEEVKQIGCQYNNPVCGSDYDCVGNQCVKKQEGCAYSNPGCDANYQCINNHCVIGQSNCPYKYRTDYNDATNPQPCFEKNTEEGFVTLNKGESCTYTTNNKNYIISISNISYEKLPGLEGEGAQPIATFEVKTPTKVFTLEAAPTKYLKIEKIFTIETPLIYSPVPKEYQFYIHKMIPTQNIKINFVNSCDDIFVDQETNAKCKKIVENYTQLVFPTIEKISGINFGDCYKNIYINIEKNFNTAGATIAYATPYLSLGENMIKNFDTQKWGNYEVHEAIHINNACANFPSSDDGNHFFWFQREALIYQTLGNQKIADEKIADARQMYSKVEANSSMLDDKTAMWGGCHGVKTHLLEKYFIQNNQTLIAPFYKTIINDCNLLKSNDSIFFNQDITNLVNMFPNAKTLINKYCTN